MESLQRNELTRDGKRWQLWGKGVRGKAADEIIEKIYPPDTQARHESVKLSRERWDSLLRSYADYREPMAHFLLYKQIEVIEPREGEGITFLPATYVPAGQTESLLDQIGRGAGPKSQMGRA